MRQNVRYGHPRRDVHAPGDRTRAAGARPPARCRSARSSSAATRSSARAINRPISQHDPTAHAEMIALRAAAALQRQLPPDRHHAVRDAGTLRDVRGCDGARAGRAAGLRRAGSARRRGRQRLQRRAQPGPQSPAERRRRRAGRGVRRAAAQFLPRASRADLSCRACRPCQCALLQIGVGRRRRSCWRRSPPPAGCSGTPARCRRNAPVPSRAHSHAWCACTSAPG